MKILKNNNILAENCIIAETFWQKLRGKFQIKQTVLLKNCNAIHTIFLNEKIDAIFLDRTNKIIKIYEYLPPRCIIFPVLNAQNVLETDAGFVKNAKIKIGDMLVFEE